MAARIRNNSWKEDLSLKEALNKYVRQSLHREEMIDFLRRDFGGYSWSIRTLDRRLRYFDIRYTDINRTVDEVRNAVREELKGPGQLLGYRAMQKKLRQMHDMRVPRDLDHAVIYDMDPKALEERAPGFRKKKKKGHFTTLEQIGCTALMGTTK